MTDVLLTPTPDGGDIQVEGGRVQLTDHFETAVYLSLFGGASWWGNEGETEARRMTSRTEDALRDYNPIPANLSRIQRAVESDLQWFLTEKIASSVSVEVTMPARNTVTIAAAIEARGEQNEFSFTEAWLA